VTTTAEALEQLAAVCSDVKIDAVELGVGDETVPATRYCFTIKEEYLDDDEEEG
jgi:hypothetical protein